MCDYIGDSNSQRLALLPLLGGKLYDVKLMSMLAIGLKLSGWQIKILLYKRRNVLPRLYLEAFGFYNFIYWEDFSSYLDTEKAAIKFEDYLEQDLDFATIKEWKYQDCWIGPNILATLSRSSYSRLPNFATKAAKEKLRSLLKDSVININTARLIVRKLKPDFMYIVEPNYANNGPITDVAINEGVDFAHTIGCPRDDALMFRRLTFGNRRGHPSSISHENLKEISKVHLSSTENDELNKIFVDRYSGKWIVQSFNQQEVHSFDLEQLNTELGFSKSQKVAAVFSHVLWDANLFYGEDLFDDYAHWFVETVKAAIQNESVNWIIKLHPANVWKLKRDNMEQQKLSELVLLEEYLSPSFTLPPHVKLLLPDTKISTQSLFSYIDYGVTVRGTVSTELPCFGIPVFTAGTGRAHGHGFTVDSETRDDYLKKMSTIHTYDRLTDEQVLLARKHAHAIFVKRPWVMKSFRPEFGDYSSTQNPLSQNFVLSAQSINEINDNGDLQKWSNWASNRHSIDFIN